ncbi:hypothetical protein LIER_13342 [Lithospermum erythrorhizon]|uniref:Reverse transcriptase zinc-binding domain-containing protein n=1 Tax=Lithospermum erythrorhizon TaxID=34254 RepID=A0AAV3PZM6_LITER
MRLQLVDHISAAKKNISKACMKGKLVVRYQAADVLPGINLLRMDMLWEFDLRLENGCIKCLIVVKLIAVNFYEDLISEKSSLLDKKKWVELIVPWKSEQKDYAMLQREVTRDEIEACFMRSSVVDAIQAFFQTGHMPKFVNNTSLILIPKVQQPKTMRKFRPIACCNVLYKGISTEIVNGYHKRSGRPRCFIKVVVMKAYDSVDWSFLWLMMEKLNFSIVFIAWIKKSLNTVKEIVHYFGEITGLKPNLKKISVYFAGNVDEISLSNTLGILTVFLPKLMIKEINGILQNVLWCDKCEGKEEQKWLHSYRLKGVSIWGVHKRSVDTNTWSKMLNLILKMRPLIVSKVGDGQHTSFLFDNWYPMGILDEVLKVVRRGKWPSSKSTNTEIQACIDGIPVIDGDVDDTVVWFNARRFTVKSMWQQIRYVRGNSLWHKLVWFKGNVPKFGFTAWLLCKRRLPTRDRLQAWGIVDDNSCVLCGEQEDIHHLFFSCQFSSRHLEDASNVFEGFSSSTELEG